MTEPAPKRRSPAMTVVVTALGGFLAVMALLSFQMRSGADPALKGAAYGSAPAARIIVKRRVIEKRVIITDAPPASATTPAPTAIPASAPSSVTSAPHAAAPQVQIVHAPPVPIPAPVTRTS